jgi:hypothetical protein
MWWVVALATTVHVQHRMRKGGQGTGGAGFMECGEGEDHEMSTSSGVQLAGPNPASPQPDWQIYQCPPQPHL